MTTRFKKYVHAGKESNDDLVAFFGDESLKYCGYEEELIYEYDSETKTLTLIGAGGKFLGDEEITPGELEDIPECEEGI